MRFAGWWRGKGRLPALMVTALLLLAPAMGPAAESSPGRGFVASFGAVPARDGRLPLQALAVTDSAPGSMARQRDAATDWQVRWIDEDGRSLADARVPDPRRPLLGSSDARQPLALRFADHRDAVLVEVRDAAGLLRGEVPLDAGSRVRADTAAEAVKDRLAAASRRTAKRDGRPAAADAAIRATFQVDVQQRVDALRDVRCSPARMGFRIPEQVVADPCRAGDADVGSEPRPAAVPPRLAGPRKPRAASTGIPRLAVSGLPRAAATNPLSGPSPSGSPRDPSFPTVRRPAEPVGPLFDVGPRRATQPPPGGFAVAKRPHRERVSETVTLTGRVLFPAGRPRRRHR